MHLIGGLLKLWLYSELCYPVEWTHNSSFKKLNLNLEIVEVFNTNLDNFLVSGFWFQKPIFKVAHIPNIGLLAHS